MCSLTTAEGEQGDSHSIPVLGYYGSWTDSSMFDIGSYIAYANGLETRAPYMYVYNGDNSVNNQALTIKAVGETKGSTSAATPSVWTSSMMLPVMPSIRRSTTSTR